MPEESPPRPLEESPPPAIRFVSPPRPLPYEIALPPSPTLSYTYLISDSPLPPHHTFPLHPQPRIITHSSSSPAFRARTKKSYLPPVVDKGHSTRLRKAGSLKEKFQSLAKAGSLYGRKALALMKKSGVKNVDKFEGEVSREQKDFKGFRYGPEELEWEEEGERTVREARTFAGSSIAGTSVASRSSGMQPRNAGQVGKALSGSNYSASFPPL